MNEAWIIDACTPRGIGKPGKGALSDIHPQHLGATVLKALTERNDFDTAKLVTLFGAPAVSAAYRVAIWAAWRHLMQDMM